MEQKSSVTETADAQNFVRQKKPNNHKTKY